MKKCITSAMILLILVTLSPISIWGNNLGVAGLSLDQYITKLDATIPQLLEKYKVPGISIALVQDGQIVLTKGYGLKDVHNNLPVETETVFQIASISKSMTAWGIMNLVQEGKLDLDAPVADYLTRWNLPTSKYNSADVTIRRLLSHTAGISLHSYPGLDPEDQLPSLEESLSGQTGGVGKVYIKYEPGTRYAYSGGGYTILQLVIEEVSGKRFAEYMDEAILTPLQMTNSSFGWNEKISSQIAIGYNVNGKELPNYLFTAQAAAGLNATAPDMANWITATIQSYRGIEDATTLLDRRTLDLMFTPVMDGYGLGYSIETLPHGEKLVHHTGGNAGWKSFQGILLEKGNGIVILTNSDRGLALIEVILNEWFEWQGVEYREKFPNNLLMHLINFYNTFRRILH